MALPTYETALSDINTFIIANGNNEITANVLNPVLKVILDFANNNIGDLDNLTTDEKDSIVEAINSLKQNFEDLVNNGVQLYTGIDNPNDTPPPTYKYADFYMQVDIDSLPVKLWQWNGFVWTDASQEPATESDNVNNNSDVTGVSVTDALNNLLTSDANALHRTGNETFSGLKTGSATNASPATTGFAFTNNYNGGTTDALNAPIQYINNKNGIGLGGQNNGIGVLNAAHNVSSGILNSWSSATGSTGFLMKTLKNNVQTGYINDLGEYHAPRFEHTTANKNNALLASGETLPNPGHRTGMYFKGKQIYFYGDSYTLGFGATVPANRWTTLLTEMLGAVEINLGVGGTTMEKRVPIDYMAGPNMVDNIPTIPTKTPSIAMLVLAYGLNDLGQTAPAYNVTNFIADYTTVMNGAIAKGWNPSQILIIPPYYIGTAGYNHYATITGNAAPTLQRHLDFIDACRQVAQTFGAMYFDMYDAQKKNDTTLFFDNIHANDAGNRAIAMFAANYLNAGLLYNASSAGFIPKTVNESVMGNSALYQDVNNNIVLNGNAPNIASTGKTISINSNVLNTASAFQLNGNTSTNGTVTGAVYFGNMASPGVSNAAIYTTREGGNSDYADIHFDVRGSGGYRSNAFRIYNTGGTAIGGATDLGNGTLNVSGTATAATPTLSTHLATKGYVDGLLRPYKVYTALISQSGTSAPTAVVLENTLGGTVTYSRTVAGNYLATLTGAFVSGKTACLITPATGTFVHQAVRSNNNDVAIVTLNNSNIATDSLLNTTTFEIRVYN